MGTSVSLGSCQGRGSAPPSSLPRKQKGQNRHPSLRLLKLTGGLEYHHTGAGKIPVNYLPALLGVLLQLLLAGCNQRQSTGPQLGCSKGGFASMVVTNPAFWTRHQSSTNPWFIGTSGLSAQPGATTGSSHQGEHVTQIQTGEICRWLLNGIALLLYCT